MTYALDHAQARADILDAGAAVTFTKITFTRDALTGSSVKSTASVPGAAVEVKGDPKRYLELGLTVHTAVTLLFAPDTYGQLPELGATCTWASRALTVKNVDPVAPDGTAIIARVVCEV